MLCCRHLLGSSGCALSIQGSIMSSLPYSALQHSRFPLQPAVPATCCMTKATALKHTAPLHPTPVPAAHVSVAEPATSARPAHRRRCWHGRCQAQRSSTQWGGDPTQMGGNPYWWEELEQGSGQEDLDQLSAEEVEERVEEAAAFISVLEDMQPLDNPSYNAFAEVWTRIARIPPKARVQLLSELEPGALRSLWKASMSRYVLSDARAMQLLADFSVLEDFPQQPGQVMVYEGCAERWEYTRADSLFSVDRAMQSRYPRSQPWLRPNQGRMRPQRQRFSQHFFIHPRSGEMHAKVVLPWWGPLDAWWLPVYCRVRPSLVLTPIETDAGADMTFEYQRLPNESDLQQDISPIAFDSLTSRFSRPQSTATQAAAQQGVSSPEAVAERVLEGLEARRLSGLLREDLPDTAWPKPPDFPITSPFSQTARDYVRVAGPGVYVGCAYPLDANERPNKDICVFFLLVRKA